MIVFRGEDDPARFDLPQVADISRGIELVATEHGAESVRAHRARFDLELGSRSDLELAEGAEDTVRIADHTNLLDACFSAGGHAVYEVREAGGGVRARAELPGLRDCRAIGHAYPGVRIVGLGGEEPAPTLMRVELTSDAVVAGGPTPIAPSGGGSVAAVASLNPALRTTMCGAGAFGDSVFRVWTQSDRDVYEVVFEELAIGRAPPAVDRIGLVRFPLAVLVARDRASSLVAFRFSPTEIHERVPTGIEDAKRHTPIALDGTRGLAAIAGMTFGSSPSEGTVELVVLDISRGTEPSRLSIPVRYPPERDEDQRGGVDVSLSPITGGVLHWSDWVPSETPGRPAEHVTKALLFTCDAL